MDQYTLDFLQISPENIRKVNNLEYIVWAMDTCAKSDDTDLVQILQKHLRKLFPEWEKIFGEGKQKTRLDSIDLSKNAVNYFRESGYVFVEEILKSDFRKFNISITDINRLWVIIKSNQLLEIILLSDTNLSARSREILNQNNITTLNQLEYYSTHDILRLKNSMKLLIDIEETLNEHGLAFNKNEQ